jgi:hypothetical protein
MNLIETKQSVPIVREMVVFEFEKEFVEDRIRCIPMMVRYKLDITGIKLSLAQWFSIDPEERFLLASLPCDTQMEIDHYETSLDSLLQRHGLGKAERLHGKGTLPSLGGEVFERVNSRALELGKQMEPEQWQNLTLLQRFALSKLIRPGHESKNFIPALLEFGLLDQTVYP